MPKQTTQPDEKMTREDAAQFLGVNARTLYRLTQSGKLARHTAPVGTGRGGRRFFYLRSDLEQLKAQMIAAPTPSARDRK